MLVDLQRRQGQEKTANLLLLGTVVFLEPQRPDSDIVLPTPTKAASSQCLPLQHRFYLVVLGILQGQEVGSLGLQPSLQGPS